MPLKADSSGVITSVSADSFLSRAVDGISNTLFPGDDVKGITISEARYATFTALAAGVIGGGIFARKRAVAGQAPYMGFLL